MKYGPIKEVLIFVLRLLNFVLNRSGLSERSVHNLYRQFYVCTLEFRGIFGSVNKVYLFPIKDIIQY